MKITIVGPDGKEHKVSQKAFDLVYSNKGFTLKKSARAAASDESESTTSTGSTRAKSASKRKASKASKRKASKTPAKETENPKATDGGEAADS